MLPVSVSTLTDEDVERVDQHLKDLLKVDNRLLTEIGSYICKSGGKRIRPVLLLLSAQLAGYRGPRERAVHLSAIIEFIHAATLLHDDVVDNAHMRRGNPSANHTWGNQLPVLVGDYLYATCFYLLVEDNNPEIMKTVSGATATITNGEILQLQKSRDFSLTEEEYIEIITKKTATLMAASCRIGAILGQVAREQEDALLGYGTDVGIAFQLMDDLLDYTSQEKALGKPVKNDLKEGNCTLPLIRTLQLAPPEEVKRIHSTAGRKECPEADLLWIDGLVKKYQADEYTLDRALWYVERAKQKLHLFQDSPYRQALLDLADYIVQRNF
jgi:octaprenyl-diphosphate synthase